MRPQTPIPLTLEEHRELGVELREINARLQALSQVVISVYGPQTQAAFTFQKVADQVQRLCEDMQAQATRDLPGFSVDGFYTRNGNSNGNGNHH